MKKRIRIITQALFIFFVIAVFCCITALTIIIAQGGKITREGITQTGILRINSEPSEGIKVYVDGQKVSLIDKRVEGLEEGKYTIRIEKDGYLPWEKEVSVDQGIVREIYASLLKEDLELQQLTNTNIDRVFFSPEGNYTYYVITKSEIPADNGIWRLKLSQNTLESIGFVKTESERVVEITTEFSAIMDGNYSIDIAPDNSKFVIRNDDKGYFYIYHISTAQLIDIKSPTSLGFVPESYSWFKNGDSMIARLENSIYEINLSSNQVNLVYNFQETNPIYAVNGRNVIIFANNQYYNYENGTKQLLNPKFDLPVPDMIWLSAISNDLLFVKSDGILYFSNLKKEIVKVGEYGIIDISNDGQNALLQGADGALYSFRGELIIATDKISISVKMIQKTYDEATQAYKFSPDNNYLLERILQDGNCTFRLIGLYGENNYDLLTTTRYVGEDNFGLVNDSREFMILLKDIVPNITLDANPKSTPDANLYKIELSD